MHSLLWETNKEVNYAKDHWNNWAYTYYDSVYWHVLQFCQSSLRYRYSVLFCVGLVGYAGLIRYTQRRGVLTRALCFLREICIPYYETNINF
jgi:hypothetical protein